MPTPEVGLAGAYRRLEARFEGGHSNLHCQLSSALRAEVVAMY